METRISESSETYRNWLELPLDVTSTILLKLGAVEILTNAQNVCSLWRKLCKDVSMWRSIDMRNLGDLWDMDCDLVKMAMHAVDRSCGQLVHINIEHFGTDSLLEYIADRSSHLKRLRLVRCYGMTDDSLITEAMKLQQLEELELSYCSFSRKALVAVGCSCPRLKSFKLNNQGYRSKSSFMDGDEEVLAIAETMHDLRHLQLFGNQLTNIGLQAILDGCPHLESLDLRQCFNLNLREGSGKACIECVKYLRGPNDSTSDYEFDAEFHESCDDDESYDDGYPYDFSDLDIVSDDEDYEFSGGSDFSDYDYDLFY